MPDIYGQINIGGAAKCDPCCRSGQNAASDQPSESQPHECASSNCPPDTQPSHSRNTLNDTSRLVRTVGDQLQLPIPALRGGPAKVNLSNGNVILTLGMPGTGAWYTAPAVTYNSTAAATASQFGYGWSGLFDVSVTEDAGAGTATLQSGSGTPVFFAALGQGGSSEAYLSRHGNNSRLFKLTAGGFQEVLANGGKLLFSSAGELTQYQNQGGKAWTINGNSIVSPYNQRTTISVGGTNIHVTDPAGRITTLIQDGSDNIIQHITPELCVTELRYDGNHRLTATIDPEGYRTSYTYDGNGWVNSIRSPNGGATTIVYDTDFSTITDPAGNTTTVNYNLARNITSVVNPLGATTSYTWDANMVQTFTNPNGKVTTFSYDKNDDGTRWLRTLQMPSAGISTFAYDAENRVSLLKNADAYSSTLIWNGSIRTAVIDPAGYRHSYSYDSGVLDGETNPLGEAIQFINDSLGNRVAVIDPLGNRTSYIFDSANQIQANVDPLGNRTTFVRDLMNRVLAQIEPSVSGRVSRTTTWGTCSRRPIRWAKPRR
ncbi:hypothetical protein [Symmachiella dynata]|uniref:hypothetical protein n=1 Tax=Symmachiella dynata TaxID=2527995 RepID=UPI0030EDBFB5